MFFSILQNNLSPPQWEGPSLVLQLNGQQVFKATPSVTDMKMYLNAGALFARASPIAGDKLLSLINGIITAS